MYHVLPEVGPAVTPSIFHLGMVFVETFVYPPMTDSICQIPFLKNLFCRISHVANRPTKPSSLQDITTLYQYFLLSFE